MSRLSASPRPIHPHESHTNSQYDSEYRIEQLKTAISTMHDEIATTHSEIRALMTENEAMRAQLQLHFQQNTSQPRVSTAFS